jgi:DMSO/TMAO reductase YedYZ heme-binding membrane subunit
VVFLAIHVVTAVLDTYVHIGWLAVAVPFTSSYDRVGIAVGAVGTDLVMAVAVSSALRAKLPAHVWRWLHWLAYLSWPVALSHTLAMGPDTGFAWSICLVTACTALVAGAALWRLVAAFKARSGRPVTAVSPRRSLRAAHITGDAD